MEQQRDRSDDEDKYRRRRDGDRRGRDRDRSDTEKVTDRRDRYRNRSDDEDGNDRRRRDRNRDRDRRNGDEYVSNKGGARKTSDDEEYDDETRRGRSRVLKGDDEYRDSKRNEDRRRRSRSVEDNGDGRSNMKTSEDGKRRKEVAKKHEENSDGEDGEIRKTEIKGKREDISDDEDGEIRKRGTKGKDRSDDEDDRKDRSRRDVRKSRSDEEDDKYKRRRDELQRAYKRNDKHQLLAAVKFIAHLVNQQVVHELIALELLTLLLENPTDDSVEVAVGFVTECGSILQDLSPKGLHGIFERFRGILHEGEIDKRVQFLIEGLFALRKAKFQGHAAVRPELDLVELEDQLTHEVSLLDKIDPEISLDIFKMDPDFLENEKRYEDLKKTILGDESSDEDDDKGGEESDDDDEDESSEEEDEEQMRIRDETETNLVNLRRTIYLTIMSSVDFEEAGHKLLKIKLEPGQEMELCIMLLECCSQERTYLRYYGLLGQRFCMINKVHQENFEKCFVQQYSMIHRLETNKLRNVAKFFAHLLGTDALPWHVLAYIRLTEEDTTSSSRIFIKILFQELSEHLGIRLLNERLSDPSMQADFESIFPRDNPKNTRFSINFFTSIGLGGITENLREYLKNMPRLIMQQKPASESDDSGSSSSGSESSSSEESESSSESSDSERDQKSSKRRRRR
ncbi:putative MIF4G-like, type 3, initiation factor eIF-4 gamma, MA3, MIF4G-like domain superfamily [Helianthus annuus]|nr:putative MIF4G-like, type 3, initiation factor eIF-4 gamma, MA3, MIF4G-like domain superfamily [Helianthus annuus]KAJ0674970.1 putative MIF4G-like, type 3, initiation factor eIF-4 gamma, MA3, MIF4G-like domain superfamily [Helianthus annuus]